MEFLWNEEKFNRYGYYLVLLVALASALSPKLVANCSYLAIPLALFRYYKFKVGIKLDPVIKFGIIVFFIGLLISSSFAPNWPQGYQVTYTFFQTMWPLLITFLFVNTRRQLVTVITVLAISIGVSSGYGAFQGLNGTSRVSAFFYYVNAFAFFLDIYIPLLFVVTIEKDLLPRKYRIVTGVVLVFAIMALIYTESRGAWLAIGLTFLAYAIMKIRENKKLGIVLCLAFVILSAAFLQSDRIQNRLESIFNPRLISNTERILMWESAVAMWRDYPLVGVGLSNYKTMNEKYISPLHKEKNHPHAHNNFLNVLAETGLLGISGFLILFACILYQSVRKIKNPLMKAALLITSTFLLHGLVDYNFNYRSAMQAYWFILGLSFASIRIFAEGKNDLE